MAKNISLLGADYPDVPAVQLPQTGGGKATFYDINVVDDLNSDSSTDALSARQGKVLKGLLADYVKIIEASLGATGTIAGKSSVLINGVDVSSYIPSGYKLIGAFGRYPGDQKFCFVQVVTSNNLVTARIGNYTDTAESGTASVWLICIRN